MFEKTRIKLTAWYLVIIMATSLLFSVSIYTGVNHEFTRFERFQERFGERQRRTPPRLNTAMINEARMRVISVLGFINLAILGIAGTAGYFLAGRTLRPIKQMVDEQNRFITDSSHELRTPLTSLRSEIEVNLRNKSLSLPEAKKLLESNLEEVLRLQVLSDSLLELAQNGKPMSDKDMTEVSLVYCIDFAIKKLDGLSKKKQIKIEKKINNIKIYGIQDRICGSGSI